MSVTPENAEHIRFLRKSGDMAPNPEISARAYETTIQNPPLSTQPEGEAGGEAIRARKQVSQDFEPALWLCGKASPELLGRGTKVFDRAAWGPPRDQARRNARILADRLPPSRRWQLDTSQGAMCQVTGLTYGQIRAVLFDQRPASERGLTLERAVQQYGCDRGLLSIAQRDFWGVCFIERRDAEEFCQSNAHAREREAHRPEWRRRIEQRGGRR